MRYKMSKQNLYLFMQQQMAQLYRRAFGLAWETICEAQAALGHERPDLRDRITSAIPQKPGPGSWDSLHSGLMARERLEFGLHSMHIREVGWREYELSKHCHSTCIYRWPSCSS